jgi:predicted aspartyl protease
MKIVIETLEAIFMSQLTYSDEDIAVLTPVHKATVLWHGREEDIAVLSMGCRPLLGTALLEDCHLNLDFREGGAVVLVEL